MLIYDLRIAYSSASVWYYALQCLRLLLVEIGTVLYLVGSRTLIMELAHYTTRVNAGIDYNKEDHAPIILLSSYLMESGSPSWY